ncbi:MAG: nucleoside hydrolase [Proteobacteria bacterium]|nr:nucleoside hydrolase [Pseudomonadota bacterium]
MTPSQTKHLLLLDTDPGIDDAMAIHYCFAHPAIRLLGLTTIFGNVYTKQATRNALFLCEQAHATIPVSQGADKPLAIPPNPPAHFVHGDEGLGDLPAQPTKTKPAPTPAHKMLADTIRTHPNAITLAAIGPLTNIARLIAHDPTIPALTKKLVIMGGAVDCPGNVTPHAEANIWNDPHAADQVFAADWAIDMIGLDITSGVECQPSLFASIKDGAPEIGGFLKDIAEFYIRFYSGVIGRNVCLLHDPTAMITLTQPDAFGFEEIPLRVICDGDEIGATRRDTSGKRRPVRVAKKVDAEAVRNNFVDICRKADTMRDERNAC